MSSFIAVAWLTVLVSVISTSYDCWLELKMKRNRLVNQEQEHAANHGVEEVEAFPSRPTHSKVHLLMMTSKSFLGPLCDLQAFTGTAIVIAGFSQWQTISFYHEALVATYWWLTLNSFFAGRVNYMDIDTDLEPKKVFIRRLAVLSSCILGLSFQCLVIVRENNRWDDDIDEHCYRWRDDTSIWPWIAGSSVYTATLLVVMVPQFRPKIEGYLIWKDRKLQGLTDELVKQHDLFKLSTSQLSSPSAHSFTAWSGRASRLTCLLLAALRLSVFWTTIQFLGIWSYGDGYLPLFVLAYFCFNIQNTFDVITLKTLNIDLIMEGDELKMGFGQVLPLLLFVQLGFIFVDLWEGKLDQKSMTGPIKSNARPT